MSNLVNVKVLAEKHGNYKKGDTIEAMHISTAKALGSIVEVVGDYEAPKRKKLGVAVAYKGNTPAENKKAAKIRTDKAKADAEKTEEEIEAEVEAEIAAEEKVEKVEKNWLGQKKKN